MCPGCCYAPRWRPVLAAGDPGARLMGLKHTVHQIPEVRARAAARGPARSIQPGHIEFGTGNWSLWECLDGIMHESANCPRKNPSSHYHRLEELTDLHLATSPLTTLDSDPQTRTYSINNSY